MPDIDARKRELTQLTKDLEGAPVSPDDERYFPFHEAPGKPRGRDPVRELQGAVMMAADNGTSCHLFSGLAGSGKSTELLRLDRSLTASGFNVITVPGAEYVNLHQPLETTDLLLSVAVAVAEIVNERVGKIVTHEPLFARIGHFLSTKVTPKEVGANYIATLKFDLAKDPSFKVRVQEALRGRLHEFVKQLQAFLTECKTLLQPGRDLPAPVLIVDDLEKIRGTGPEQDIVQRNVEQVFSQFHWALHIDGWHTVWTVPPYLQLLNAAIPPYFDSYSILPMVRVVCNDDTRSPDRQGIAAMRTCLKRRGPVESLFRSEELLERVILASGGHLRDLLSLLRRFVLEAYMRKDPSSPLTEEVVEGFLEEDAQSKRLTVYDTDVDWLRRVARTRDISIADRSAVQRAAQLLDTSIVLTYKNGNPWFDVHPAILPKIRE